MALLTANGDGDEAASSYVFWAIVALLVVFAVVAIAIGLTRLL